MLYFYSEIWYTDDFVHFTIDLVKCRQKFTFWEIKVAFQQIQENLY